MMERSLGLLMQIFVKLFLTMEVDMEQVDVLYFLTFLFKIHGAG